MRVATDAARRRAPRIITDGVVFTFDGGAPSAKASRISVRPTNRALANGWRIATPALAQVAAKPQNSPTLSFRYCRISGSPDLGQRRATSSLGSAWTSFRIASDLGAMRTATHMHDTTTTRSGGCFRFVEYRSGSIHHCRHLAGMWLTHSAPEVWRPCALQPPSRQRHAVQIPLDTLPREGVHLGRRTERNVGRWNRPYSRKLGQFLLGGKGAE